MEGIAGVIYPDVYQVNHHLEAMLDTMRHRGQDIRDTYSFKNIQIGLCGGKLATNEKKYIYAGVDGFFVNADEIRDELKKQGCAVPHSPTQAELIVYAYELWGTGLFKHMNGDFAIVILDQHKEKLILARDRMGKKPLYWFHDQHNFIFASELKALLATGAVPQTISSDAIASYLYFGFIPQDLTPIKDANKLLAGHFLQFSPNRSMQIQSYWSFSSYFEHKPSMRKSVLVGTLDQMLQKALQVRLPKNEFAGCFVSGGLGSATVAYYLKKASEHTHLYSFSVGLKGENEAGIEIASDVSKTLGIAHETEIITPQNFLDDLVKIAWHLDEPLADPNVVATWRLAALASQKTDTVFSGMGSDELLAGHSRYKLGKSKHTLYRLFKKPLSALKGLFVPILNYIYEPLALYILKHSRIDPWQFEYLRQNALFNEKKIAAAAPNLAGLFDPEIFLHKFHNLSRIKSPVSSFLYFDVKTRLADSHIMQVERMTSAHGLNWHAPFLDQHIVEFLAGHPETERLAEKDTALFLKSLLGHVYPDQVLDHLKSHRKDLLASLADKPEIKEVFKLLPKGTLVESGLVSEHWLRHKLEENPQESFRYLWAILMLEIWYRLFINHPIDTKCPEVSLKELLSEK